MSSPKTYSTPPVIDESKFGVLSWSQNVWMNIKVRLGTPLIIALELLLSPFVARSKHKPYPRIIGDASFRFLADYFSGPELQRILGSSVDVYSTWARNANLPINIEEMVDGGKLMWIGPKRTDKMLLYCHGGAYIFAVQIFTISFWRYIQVELEKRGLNVGIAIMSYSLVPVSQFPTPLWQTSLGDSAGGNLVSQVLSSMLHPLFTPPIIPRGTQLRGAYMMSPWISLTGIYENHPLPSFTENDHCDVIGKESLLKWGQTVLSDWYAHLPDIVDRVFVSTGGAECLRDADEIFFREKIKPYHGKCEYYEMEGGVHNDPFFDFQVAEGPLGGKRQGLTPRVLQWVWGCFEEV
ncbi:Meiotically up-regulated gene 180 protein [Lentinula edodes]|uniref:Meiotically up-regulated gene 180 protein n=1 Tax=Lentinula edodes TaxID=5353 RepID=A0A1Q3EQK1_LENED|nr:Meiotically up-regulated gene 180 protein [Lentinula edodes]